MDDIQSAMKDHYLCIFTKSKERAETQLWWLCIRQRKLTRTFLSLFFPCPFKYHTHSNGQLKGSRWGVQINTGEEWWNSWGWAGEGEEEGREGLPGGKGKLQCHFINMTVNKRRFKFLNRKQTNQKEKRKKHMISFWVFPKGLWCYCLR